MYAFQLTILYLKTLFKTFEFINAPAIKTLMEIN